MPTLTLLPGHQRDGWGPDQVVALGAGTDRTARDLLRDAARVASRLPEADHRSEVLLVFREDRYLLTVALLAAWSRGHAVALPPNTRRDAVWRVSDRAENVEILHDTEAGGGIAVDRLLADPADGDVTSLQPSLPPDDKHLVTVFTSGSSEQPRGVTKTRQQLLGEAETLARLFDFAGKRVLCTVPAGHLYGLLFSVLAPLCGGAAFARATPLHAESIARAVRELGADVLVTVPAHLRALRAVQPGALSALSRVFCSTAPLPQPTWQRFAEAHDVGVTEIFGSTETGGVAWRDRAAGERWRVLPGVSLDVDGEGHLLVSSPFVETEAPYRTQDLIELDDSDSGAEHATFTHLGRADGVVKVGGRRVSLAALESALRQQPGVDDAAVVGVRDDDESARGTTILAAVAGKDLDVAKLRQALGEQVDASCLPRRFVFVDALPREDTGKLARERLMRLFDRCPDGAPMSWQLSWRDGDPVARDAADGEHALLFRVHVPARFGWFDGHFGAFSSHSSEHAGYPILMAAVQLRDVVMPCIRRARPELGAVRQMSRMKFLKRIKPDDHLDIELRWREHSDVVSFALRSGDQICSSGTVSFVEEARS